MEYVQLGRSGLKVSRLCLGTMNFGPETSQADSNVIMDHAHDQGINFFDSANIYGWGENAGQTERIVGDWFAQGGGRRERTVLATKLYADMGTWPNDGKLSALNIRRACDASLKRLQTDYIDLYQLHWPERSTNFFGQLGYKHKSEANLTPLEDTLEALDEQVRAGKIRHIGLSNETPWGTMRFLALAEARGWPRAVSIQNPYNLLNRSFEVGLAEIAIREQCGLLAYSPLAFGFLSGKYEGGARPPKGRLSLYSRFSRYFNPQSEAACSRYVALAREHGLDPAQMALAFVTQQAFVTSNIIGATTLEQLDSNIASFELKLSDEVLAGIEAIHKDHPNPAP